MLIHLLAKKPTTQGGFNIGGINATGQIPFIPGGWGLIDVDTPKEAYTKPSYTNPGEQFVLVFSDEFNTEGRTFYPGDDPYWEAPNLHYWGTVCSLYDIFVSLDRLVAPQGDLEWYDPSAVTTKGGALALTLSKQDPATNHNLTYRSGMVGSFRFPMLLVLM